MECIECKAVADGEARGWWALRADLADAADRVEVVFYCALCATREFAVSRRPPPQVTWGR